LTLGWIVPHRAGRRDPISRQHGDRSNWSSVDSRPRRGMSMRFAIKDKLGIASVYATLMNALVAPTFYKTE
jgi:hypothetical protein